VKTDHLFARAAVFGFAGWAAENVLSEGKRCSALFKGAHVPFLPIYAAGGTAAMLLAPHLRALPWYARGAAYAAALSGVELVGCAVDRDVLGACSWDYSGQGCARGGEGCVDLKRAALWGMLGLCVEKL